MREEYGQQIGVEEEECHKEMLRLQMLAEQRTFI
jgi:hypothetical protein